MPVVFDPLLVELFTHRLLCQRCLIQKLFLCTHRCPLKGSEGLRDKEGGTGNDLYRPVSLFFWNNLIIEGCNLVGQFCDPTDIFFCFKGQPQHEIQLHAAPSALKCKSCAL